MAKISIINRNIKRLKLVHKYAEKRSNLNNIMNDLTLTEDERHIARIKLQKMIEEEQKNLMKKNKIITFVVSFINFFMKYLVS